MALEQWSQTQFGLFVSQVLSKALLSGQWLLRQQVSWFVPSRNVLRFRRKKKSVVQFNYQDVEIRVAVVWNQTNGT